MLSCWTVTAKGISGGAIPEPEIVDTNLDTILYVKAVPNLKNKDGMPMEIG